MYARVHSSLVRLVPSYRRLIEAIEATVRREQPAPGPLAAIPCSTGEWVRPLADLGRPWTLVDVSPASLAWASRGLPGCEGLVVDLAGELPLPPGSQDLVLCVHALHVLPEPARQLERFADLLGPGGVLVLVTFDADETVAGFARRVRRDHGRRVALSMLPWKVLDRLWTGPARYDAATELERALEAAGLEVRVRLPVFAGTSTLRVARAPGE